MKASYSCLLAVLTLCACQNQPSKSSGTATPDHHHARSSTVITAAQADRTIEEINKQIKADYPESTAAQWVAETYINDDTQLLSAKANERSLAKLSEAVEKI